jgi:hypothetical protein
MNLIPKAEYAQIDQHFFDGIISPTMTMAPTYYWDGFIQWRWLCFEFKTRLKQGKHFNVALGRVWTIGVKKGLRLTVNYNYREA